MLVERLLEHFDSYTRLHIDVNDVRDQLVDLGVADEITFHFVKMDALKIRGIVYQYERRDGVYREKKSCAAITIADEMGDDGEDEYWQRLVAVKEMLHLLDSEDLRAESKEAVESLIRNFSIPPELRKEGNGGVTRSYLNDRVRIFIALAVLVPESCRELLRTHYKVTLSDREIATIAKIPTRYVAVVMDEAFEEHLKLILEFERAHQQG